MRFKTSSLVVVGGLLFAAATGHAKVDTATKLRIESIEARLPDVGRLERLEQQLAQLSGDSGSGSSSGAGAPPSNMFGLLQDIQSLQEEVRQLRGQVDQIKFDLQQARQREKDLYQDLDSRLQQLESGGVSAGGSSAAGTGPVDEEAAEKAYLAARDALANGQYGDAANGFRTMVEQHPGSRFEPAAYYWMGEANYVQRNYAEAEKALTKVISDFPDADKAPDAMYRLGVVYDEQGKARQARDMLNGVSEQFPDTRAAQQARKHLKAIGG